MSAFFIGRPIFAGVLSCVIVLMGGVAYFLLPVAQYPEITPPTVQVRTAYPGATPQVVADTVGQPIEQEVNGVEGMLYMESSSSADGTYQLDVTFELGTDIDMATVLVQNRVSVAMPRLPEDVRRAGVTTKKQSSAIVALVTIASPGGEFDDVFLTNFFNLRLKDEILRIKGVGSISVFPDKDYGMRVWLQPDRLRRAKVTALDVVNAIRSQNVQVAAGRIGQEPAPEHTAFDVGVTLKGRLSDPAEFGQIIVRQEGGDITRVRDVATVEIGGKSYTASSTRNGAVAAAALVFQAPGSNAIEVADELRALIERERPRFPDGVDVSVDYDISGFINASIREVYVTLFQAFLLVGLVVLVFLQSWRSTIIPILAIPVSLIGTFAVMAGLGFTLNMVTLLGLVLAIGIVVDDAIVVVESVQRLMAEGLAPREATLRAMREVSAPVVATTLVLMSVFIPAAAMPGITGQIYRQFALTIAVSTVFSSVNALTMSPALCALLLRPTAPDAQRNPFARAFDWVFRGLAERFGTLVAQLLRRMSLSLVALAALLGLTFHQFSRTPTGFVPTEDQGLVLFEASLPAGASLQRTKKVMGSLSPRFQKLEGVESVVSVSGFGMLSGLSPNNGLAFAILDPWDQRAADNVPLASVRDAMNKTAFNLQEASAFAYELPPIPGLGQGDGFDLRLQDVRGYGSDTLEATARALSDAANAQSRLSGVATTFRAVSPQLRLDLDRDQAMRRGVQLADVFGTLSATLGTAYVNDFTLFGRSYQVRVSAEPESRADRASVGRFAVRNDRGEMVPLGAFSRFEDAVFPNRIQRYNLYPSAQLTGRGARGVSSGDALSLMEQVADEELPDGMRYAWSSVSFQEKSVGGQAVLVFLLGMLMVFLVLAAQYESLSLPLAVIGTIPLALLGAMVAVGMRGFDNNIFVQAGLVLLVGLAAKNAILIVEVAKSMREQGRSAVDAALDAARQRFRPILMTALSFILGVLPLVFAGGAGAAARTSVGTAVFGGMLAATALGVFAAPVLFVVVDAVSGWLAGRGTPSRRSG